MSDYISREAAIDVMCKILCDGRENCDENTFCCSAKLMKSIPAADVRPVVRCKDCVYAYPYGLEIKCTKHSGRADRFGEDATYSEFHEESWFCADGEERKHE